MAIKSTSRGTSTRTVTKREANAIYRSFIDENGIAAARQTAQQNAAPKRTLDNAIDDIYLQAHTHRNRLVTFYIVYTVAFSIFVALVLTFQAFVRITPGNEQLEVIPQWALNILVAGMFGQFISLLTIVTKKVWTFEPFLKHHLDYKGEPTAQSNEQRAKSGE